jgi:HK97 family phage prohead protease
MKTNNICLRAVEFRAEGATSDGRTLEGYAAVFDTPARIMSWEGEFDEQIARGAFAATIKKRTPVLQFDHGRDVRTGSVPIGAIKQLEEQDPGLWVQARLFDNQVVEPIRQAVEEHAIGGMSIRFGVAAEKWTDSQGVTIKAGELDELLWQPGDRGPLLRTITKIDPLYELGPVVFPAYDTTSVGVRSLMAQLTADEHRELLRELAADLRRIPDLNDFTGQSSARSADGSEPDAKPKPGEASPSIKAAQARDRLLRLKGIVR